MRRHLKYSGIAGVVVYWLFVAWSISRNPWFSFWRNALSDLGSSGANSSWIYSFHTSRIMYLLTSGFGYSSQPIPSVSASISPKRPPKNDPMR